MTPNKLGTFNMGKNQDKKGKSISVKGHGIGHFRGIRINVGV